MASDTRPVFIADTCIGGLSVVKSLWASGRAALITPARRGGGRESGPGKQGEEKTPFERRVAMTWAQRLKRVFAIEVETSGECGGTVKVIASIEDPAVIMKILDHLGMNATQGGNCRHAVRHREAYGLLEEYRAVSKP